MPAVKRVVISLLSIGLLFLAVGGCGGPPKPAVPALTPENAAAMLRNYPKAQNWIGYVKRHNPACDYRLDLPDQSAQPTTIDLNHIVVCGGAPSPKEFDAGVSFEYDKNAQHWIVSRFAS
jgi:hypothetical protein